VNNTNVLTLPAAPTFTPEQALRSALSEGLTLVIGYGPDEALVIRSSRMNRGEARFLLEKTKSWVLDAET
jgi:hypothetical protein